MKVGTMFLVRLCMQLRSTSFYTCKWGIIFKKIIMTDNYSKVKGQGHKSRSNKQNIPKLSIMSLYHDENRSYILSFTHGSSEQSLNDNIIENSNWGQRSRSQVKVKCPKSSKKWWKSTLYYWYYGVNSSNQFYFAHRSQEIF